MRWIVFPLIVVAVGSCKGDAYYIPGSGTLPNCSEAPVTDLDGTAWYDNGTVTIRTVGCRTALPNDTFQSCALDWAFAQDGNDVSIVVDNEYRIDGRLCGDQLYLRGGWWLPVVDEDVGGCTYEEDSADEVGIEAEGNVLTVAENAMTGQFEMAGTLAVRGSCSADYEVTFRKSPFAP